MFHLEAAAIEAIQQWRKDRDEDAAQAALTELRRVAATDENLMSASLACARAGVTTGEWGAALREVFGEYRAPTGVGGVVGVQEATDELAAVRELVRTTGDALGGLVQLRLLFGVGAPV